MHPSCILLALASAALVSAVAIPQPAPGPSTYDTCLDQYALIFAPEIAAGAPPASIAECTSCAGQAVGLGFAKYLQSGVAAAKEKYTDEMHECRGETTDDQYNTCINEYATIFEFAPTSDIATCTGCAAEGVALAIVTYGTLGMDAAKQVYKTKMEACRNME